MQVDWDVVEAAIKRANREGQQGVRVLAAYYGVGAATSPDAVVFRVDNGPESATETW